MVVLNLRWKLWRYRMPFFQGKHMVDAAHLHLGVLKPWRQLVIYQQLLERGVGQESGIADLEWFVHPDLLVLLASSTVSFH